MILVSLLRIQVSFYLRTLKQERDSARYHTPTKKQNKTKKTTAIIDRQQSVIPAGQQSKSAGEVRLFPHISSNLSCLAVGHFHWLFPQTETCDYREQHHEKNWASDACFSFLNGGKQSGGTHMILTGSCLKVSLMVRLCLAFVLLQWKLQNKEGRTTQ